MNNEDLIPQNDKLKQTRNQEEQISPFQIKQGDGKLNKCEICDYSFSSKQIWKRHMESIHEGKKQHRCSICEYASSNSGNLKKHINAIHERNKPHKCSLCDFSFLKKRV